jgi:hypothetical protein
MALLALGAPPLAGQMLAGRVVDSASHEPIANVRIRLQLVGVAAPTLAFHARADSAGVFYASVPFAGRYLVTLLPPDSSPSAPIEADLGPDEAVQREFVVPRHPIDADYLYRCEEVDSLPKAAAGSRGPRFPAGASERKEGAMVEATFDITAIGRVDMSTVNFAKGANREFHREFQQAVREWLTTAQFRAALIGSRPVRTRVSQQFTFQIEERP